MTGYNLIDLLNSILKLAKDLLKPETIKKAKALVLEGLTKVQSAALKTVNFLGNLIKKVIEYPLAV